MSKKKNPNAVALGKLGGSKGGKIRALRLSAEQRKEIARIDVTLRLQSRIMGYQEEQLTLVTTCRSLCVLKGTLAATA